MNLRQQQFKRTLICETCGVKKNSMAEYENVYLISDVPDFDSELVHYRECNTCGHRINTMICIDYYSLLCTIAHIMKYCPAAKGHHLLWSELYVIHVVRNNIDMDELWQYKHLTASIVLSSDEYMMLCGMVEAC